jgi:protein-arginine kinase activator protein McsA
LEAVSDNRPRTRCGRCRKQIIGRGSGGCDACYGIHSTHPNTLAIRRGHSDGSIRVGRLPSYVEPVFDFSWMDRL